MEHDVLSSTVCTSGNKTKRSSNIGLLVVLRGFEFVVTIFAVFTLEVSPEWNPKSKLRKLDICLIVICMRGFLRPSIIEFSSLFGCQGLESSDEEGFQSFSLDFVPEGLMVESILIQMQGTVHGRDAFTLLDAKVVGSPASNPTNVYQVRRTKHQLLRITFPRCRPFARDVLRWLGHPCSFFCTVRRGCLGW